MPKDGIGRESLQSDADGSLEDQRPRVRAQDGQPGAQLSESGPAADMPPCRASRFQHSERPDAGVLASVSSSPALLAASLRELQHSPITTGPVQTLAATNTAARSSAHEYGAATPSAFPHSHDSTGGDRRSARLTSYDNHDNNTTTATSRLYHKGALPGGLSEFEATVTLASPSSAPELSALLNCKPRLDRLPQHRALSGTSTSLSGSNHYSHHHSSYVTATTTTIMSGFASGGDRSGGDSARKGEGEEDRTGSPAEIDSEALMQARRRLAAMLATLGHTSMSANTATTSTGRRSGQYAFSVTCFCELAGELESEI